MCGIAGIVQFAESVVRPEWLNAANDRLRHRGPDQQGTWIDTDNNASVGLAAVRLAVLDPTPGADQPFHRAANRFHLVYNGELYNYRELRRELIEAGEQFVTTGDTEVVLAACARWGVDALRRFNGMWALAFYDSHQRNGFLSRDRFGIKPLFHYATDARLIFASEPAAMADLGVNDQGIDPEALRSHLIFGYIPQPLTIRRGTHRLPPGHYQRFGPTGAEPPTRYFDPTAIDATDSPIDYTEACARIRRSMANAEIAGNHS